jgi:uncharacterized protein YbjT (DUF2867 family)
MNQTPLILVTGSTGYVATRLIPALLGKGYRVRCLARSPEKLRIRPWYDQVEIAQGNTLNSASLIPAMEGVTAAYYLIHNMASGRNYQENEKISARNFGSAAKAAGVEHIIYLGGLGGSEKLRHLSSRQATGDTLRTSGIPVTEFRACVIIGSGSTSFEIIRSMTDWFPLIPAPIQTNVLGQPIGIRELLAYLTGALERPECKDKIIEIGGAEQLQYPQLMLIYARQQKLKRSRMPLPFFHASLSARIADWLTPVPYVIARPLMEELIAQSILTDNSVAGIFPDVPLSGYADNVERALSRVEYFSNEPWTASLVTRHMLSGKYVRTLGEGLLIEYREGRLDTPSDVILRLFDGKQAAGWVTEAYKSGSWVRLKSGQELPGTLKVELIYKDGVLSQTAMFEPRGLPGLLWWYLFAPINSRRLARMFTQLRLSQ